MITSVPELVALRAICERLRAELEAPDVPIGHHDRSTGRGRPERCAGAPRRLLLDRHQRPDPVRAGDRSPEPELAAEADSLHPAVLRAIRTTVDGARTQGRWVGVCGGLAGDPFGANAAGRAGRGRTVDDPERPSRP
ncbi:PEP-utilizing enzyme, TIM barrel domain-containing protein [Ditylenchus destructor]|uniref:PEP-utilizing enzyme, TIM barrel domain-containing protein n=1 Tax=Ditylenchus destructor TaxID=166010 RepID=A0AAD4MHN0_9BILA|nr:PEP-utilizing enzyme, TIM barrel domain-containing protein [Ditylenchus destructor]